MLWIKRNLFLAVGGLAALILLGGSIYYVFQGLRKNRIVEEEYEAMKSQLDNLYRKNPFPAQTNIAIARQEVEKMNAAVGAAKQYFDPLPVPEVSGLAFKSLLDNTVHELTTLAASSSIELPDEDYEFSFAAQKERLQLNPDSFPGIVEQLVEVKGICTILFNARIHALISLKRVRLTSDDPPGSKHYSDDLKLRTNMMTGTILSPYEVSFTGFSSELAAVMEGIGNGRNGLLIEAMKVERFEEKEEKKPEPGGFFPTAPPKAVAPVDPNENKTVLNEERFLTTMLITVVKPTR